MIFFSVPTRKSNSYYKTCIQQKQRALTTSLHSCLNIQLLVLLLPLLTCSIYPSIRLLSSLLEIIECYCPSKKQNHTSPSNYHPISLLSILSKVLGHHIHSVLVEQLLDSNPISNRQWGFQARKSTVTTLLTVTHDWCQSLDEGREVCAVFLDLRKAFDSVPHCLLLSKLRYTQH